MTSKKLSRAEHPMFNCVDLMKAPVEQFLYYDMGFRRIREWPKWVSRLIESRAEDDLIYEESLERFARATSETPDALRSMFANVLLDHPRHIGNRLYETYIFSPFRSTEELNYFMCYSKVIIPAFRKRGFIPHVTPSLYHKNMQALDGGIYGSLVFIRRKLSSLRVISLDHHGMDPEDYGYDSETGEFDAYGEFHDYCDLPTD